MLGLTLGGPQGPGRGESPPWTPAHSPSHPLFPRVAQPGPEEQCMPRSSARLHGIFPMMKRESRFPQGGGKAKSTQCSFIVVFVNTFISTMGSSELVGHSRDCKRLGNIRSMNDTKQKNKSMSNKLPENSDTEKIPKPKGRHECGTHMNAGLGHILSLWWVCTTGGWAGEPPRDTTAAGDAERLVFRAKLSGTRLRPSLIEILPSGKATSTLFQSNFRAISK